MIFKNNKFKNFKHIHFKSLKNYNIPDNTIISHVTTVKYSDFFTTINLETDNVKGFYMSRDPREVIISSYYSQLLSHPGGHPNRENIKSMNKDDALINIINEYVTQFDVMYDWLTKCDDNRFKIIKFEEFFRNEEIQIKNMIELFDFLELGDISEIAKKNTFSKLGGRKAGKINNKHHYRAGVSDTWKSELSDNVLNYLYNKHGEKFVTDMGYKI